MKNLILVAGLGMVALFASAPAFAEPGYLGVKAGVFMPNNDDLDHFDHGLSTEIFVGQMIAPHVALELGVGFYMTSEDNSYLHRDPDVRVVPILATLKGVLPLADDSVHLFAGIGVGYYFASFDRGVSTDDHDSGFGYHMVGGAQFKLTDTVSVGGEIKWARTDMGPGDMDQDLGGITISALATHAF